MFRDTPELSENSTPEKISAYLDSLTEKTEYCCSNCLPERREEKGILDLKEQHDKCVSCKQWFKKGVVQLYRRSNNSRYDFLCPKCIEDDLVVVAFLKSTAKERSRIAVQNKRTRDLGLVSNLTIEEWLEIIERYENKCAYCGDEWTDLEHVISVAEGGGTTKANVVPSCRACNTEKRFKILQPLQRGVIHD